MGIRGFKPTLRNAAERLETLRTPEGAPLPPNTLAELRRDMARLRCVAEQIGQVEEARLERLERQPAAGRNAMVRLAWRFLLHRKGSALARWYRARTADARAGTRKTLIVALARRLLVAFWRLVTTGEAPEGVVLRAAA